MIDFAQEYQNLTQRWTNGSSEFAAGLRALATTAQDEAAEHWNLFFTALVQREEGLAPRAIDLFDAISERYREFPGADEQQVAAKALICKGIVLGEMGRSQEGLAAYEEVVSRFAASSETALREQVASALINRGIALGDIGRKQDELLAYEEMLSRFGASREPVVQEAVATALVGKGSALGEMGRTEEAMDVYDDVLRRFGGSPEPALREQVAKALVNKGIVLDVVGRGSEQLATCDEVLARFGLSSERALREAVAKALVNKGIGLARMGRGEDELAAYNEVVNRFGESSERALHEQVAKALVNKGIRLGQMSRYEEELAVYDEVVSRFGASMHCALRKAVAKALLNKGVRLGQMGRGEEELAAYGEVLSRFGASPECAMRELTAKALVNKGVRLGQLGRVEEGLAAYDEVLGRFGTSPEHVLREQVAKALVNKGAKLGQCGQLDEELAAYDEVVSLFGASPETALREQVAKALVNRGVKLGQLGHPHDELVAYDDVIKRFGTSPEPALREHVARALVNKAITLARLDRRPEARSQFEEALRFKPDDPRIKDIRALVLQDIPVAARCTPGGESQPQTAAPLARPASAYIAAALEAFDERKREDFKRVLDEREERQRSFLNEGSYFSAAGSYLMVLREWNSYTPVIPQEQERDRGGGYFLWYCGHGVVIDPGHDFIENFWRIGGRIPDIDDIILTHAHNDHTAELEDLLTLLYEYNDCRRAEARARGTRPKLKRVRLLLSVGAERKFAGFLPLRDCEQVTDVVVLNQGCLDHPQRIQLCRGLELTVLRAYHDDVITRDAAVGLGFTLGCESNGGIESKRRIIITSDTALYPLPCGRPGADQGAVVARPGQANLAPACSVFEQYPIEFRQGIDLVIAHIGSIKAFELENASADKPAFYDRHLGLRGTIILLGSLAPRAAVISEMGEELRLIREDVLRGIQRCLKPGVIRDERAPTISVFPGDPFLVYDAAAAQFLCHGTQTFEKPESLDFVIEGSRVLLLPAHGVHHGNRALILKEFRANLENHDLPYFRRS